MCSEYGDIGGVYQIWQLGQTAPIVASKRVIVQLAAEAVAHCKGLNELEDCCG